MSIGVLLHVNNPTFDDVARIARAAEEAGAEYLGVPDAFWWRDTWLLTDRALAATTTLHVGPIVTNPYLRHPFHTLAAIASLQDVYGERVHVGLGAGGAEAGAAAGADRRDAGRRIASLARLIRDVAAGAPLDEPSGRRLAIELRAPRIIVAGRGDGVLRAAGEVADTVLLWAIPHPDLARSVDVITSGAAARETRPEFVWAPVLERPGSTAARSTIAYSVLNSNRDLHERWGLSPADIEHLRKVLVAEGNAAAAALVPEHAIPDLVLETTDLARARELYGGSGASSVAVRAESADAVGAAVEWARQVAAPAI